MEIDIETATEGITFHVPSLTGPASAFSCCGAEAGTVAVADGLAHIRGVQSVFVDERAGLVAVEYDPAEIGPPTLAIVLSDLGFPPDGGA